MCPPQLEGFTLSDMENQPLTQLKRPRFFYGYVVVIASFNIQVVTWGLFNTFGVFFNPLLNEFGWPRAVISSAQSLGGVLHSFMAIIVGGLADRFGPRVVMTGCGFFFGLGYFMMSQVNTIWQVYLFYSVIMAIGVSGVDAVLLSAIARWFVKKRGMMTGIVKVGTGVGMLVLPLVISWLISGHGWRRAYVVVGIGAFVFIVSSAQFLRRDPHQMGLLPDGEQQVNAVNEDLAESGLSLREATRTRQFWMVSAALFAFFFCQAIVVVHIAPHAVDLGISAAHAAGLISIIGGASIVGRVVMGSASDRVGSKLALVICFAILLATLLWLQLAEELWMLYLFAAVYGFAHGGFFALVSPTVADLFGTSSQGAILGGVFFSGSIGLAIGPVLAGYIFDITDSYRIAFLIMTALSTVGLVLAASLRPMIASEVAS